MSWSSLSRILVVLGGLTSWLCAPAFSQPSSAAAAPRSGFDDMSPALQALQRDTGLNPAWLWVEDGRRLWLASKDGARSCAACHGELASMKRSAATHPRWHAPTRRPRTLEDQVLACRSTRQGQAAVSTQGSNEVMALAAALVAASDGEAIQADSHAELQPWIAQGQRLWHERMGQLHLSCAHCHDQRAGQRLGGNRIPQGHDTGYPVYRMEWQALGNLERRLRGCMTGIRAEPFAPGAHEWKALALYMHQRSSGLRMEAGAIRP